MTRLPDSLRLATPTAVATLAALFLLPAVFWLSHEAQLDRLRAAQAVEMRARIQTLESVLLRQRAVATVLADDSLALGALRDPGPASRDRVSQKLDRLKAETDSAVIYLLDRNGVAISASNWDETTSFVGADYSFRDYFRQAMAKGEAQQFALGTVSHRAGLYLSHDVAEPGGPAEGVVVVKVEFGWLEESWRASAARTDVRDAAGQAILSSDPALRLQPVPPPAWAEVVTAAPVPGTDWTLAMTGPGRPAIQAGLMATGTAGFALSLATALAGRVLRRRRQARLGAEAAARYRADLEQAVEAEMRGRRAAEARLDRIRAEMVQANKLAALGQITAGIAHEVNQPLATIRLLAENGSALLAAGETGELAGNLASIGRMTRRIGQITDRLRGFARKGEGALAPVALAEALEVARLLTALPRETRGIALDLPALDPGLTVMADKVALEQILVNLFQNAQEALEDRPDPRIRVTVTPGPPLRLTVEDNGPGLDPAIAGQLFTPFVTGKPRGLGLGLVISQDLARGFGADLSADPPELGRGARFVLVFPEAP